MLGCMRSGRSLTGWRWARRCRRRSAGKVQGRRSMIVARCCADAMLMLAGGGECCADVEFLGSQQRLLGLVCSDSTL